MSAATNDTNNITTSISIAVPDRILNAIEWTVQSLTDALSETLMQYQSSVVGDIQLDTDTEGNPIHQSDDASVTASSVNTNTRHHDVKEEVKIILLSVPNMPKATAVKLSSHIEAIASIIASKMIADSDKSVEKLGETLQEAKNVLFANVELIHCELRETMKSISSCTPLDYN